MIHLLCVDCVLSVDHIQYTYCTRIAVLSSLYLFIPSCVSLRWCVCGCARCVPSVATRVVAKIYRPIFLSLHSSLAKNLSSLALSQSHALLCPDSSVYLCSCPLHTGVPRLKIGRCFHVPDAREPQDARGPAPAPPQPAPRAPRGR